MKKAQKKATATAKAAMKSDGVPSAIRTERRGVRTTMQKALINDIEYHRSATETMVAKMTPVPLDVLGKTLKAAKT